MTTKTTTTKTCGRCKTKDARWTCRACGLRCCEHLTGFKANDGAATCTACQLKAARS